MDNGTQYTADDLLEQIRFLAIALSFACVVEPQTNGVVECLNRTLKEQVIHGRIFRNLEEVRAAIIEFASRYNRHWRLDKLGSLVTPVSPSGPCHAQDGMRCETVSKQYDPIYYWSPCAFALATLLVLILFAVSSIPSAGRGASKRHYVPRATVFQLQR